MSSYPGKTQGDETKFAKCYDLWYISRVSKTMKTIREIDVSKWPRRTYMARWAELLGVSITTILNRKRNNELGKGEKAINGRVLYSREEICACFHIPLPNGQHKS